MIISGLAAVFGVSVYFFTRSIFKLRKIQRERRTLRRLYDIREVGRPKVKWADAAAEKMRPALDFLELRVKLSKYDRMHLAKNLQRIGSAKTPERICLEKYLNFFGYFSIALFCLMALRIPFLFVVIFVWAIVMYFEPESEVMKKIKEKNYQVLFELPRFVRTLLYSPNDKPIKLIVEDYLKVAGEGLKSDLEIWHQNVEMNADPRDEFMAMSERIGIPAVSSVMQLIITMIDNGKGNSSAQLELMAEKTQKINLDLIHLELKKRPEILEFLCTCVYGLVAGLVAIPVGIYLLETYKSIL